jgi:hypothetical protein
VPVIGWHLFEQPLRDDRVVARRGRRVVVVARDREVDLAPLRGDALDRLEGALQEVADDRDDLGVAEADGEPRGR